MTNIDRYNTYINNYKQTWLARFTWNGLYGYTPKNKISIVNFQKQTNALDNINASNANELFKQTTNIANLYVNWCKTKGNYNDEEITDLYNFFVGAIGEYFFNYLLNIVKCMLVPNLNTGKLERFDFDNICPRLIDEEDYGVDLTGMVTNEGKYYPCALQVKFWNPFSDTPFTNKIAQSVHSDAILNDFINSADKNNIIICWLGQTNNVSQYLKANQKLYKHIVFIDMKALDNSINNVMPNFWKNFQNELSIIRQMKDI